MKVLIVEDDFTSRVLLQQLLSKYGECHVAVNGQEAIAAFKAALESGESYDLICMDIMMPEMDGQQAVLQIRELEEGKGILSSAGAKIIMITALGDVKSVMTSYKALCDEYICKPVDTRELLKKMTALGLIEQ